MSFAQFEMNLLHYIVFFFTVYKFTRATDIKKNPHDTI